LWDMAEKVQSAPEGRLLTPEDVAELLQCSRTHVYSLLRTGALPSFTTGRLRRVRRQDLDAYAEGRVTQRS
jgi:excisionase family DNA binding protein